MTTDRDTPTSTDEVKPTPVGEFNYRPAVSVRSDNQPQTELRENLRGKVYEIVEYIREMGEPAEGQDGWYIAFDNKMDKLMQLITTDRKRVELEARIDELEHIKILHRKEVYTTKSGDDINIRDRIAELKAQQEEV